jgi:hypothetical protein
VQKVVAALVAIVVGAAFIPQALAQEAPSFMNGTVYADVSAGEITLGNSLVERRWKRSGFATTALTDKRGGTVAGGAGPDFRLITGGSPAELTSERFNVTTVNVTNIQDGLRLRIGLSAPGINATRTVEAYEGIAGFRSQMTITPLVPVPLRGYTLDEAAVGHSAAPTIHAFRAGADWREPGWGGADLAIGDKHAGTWRDTRTAPAGQSLQGPAQWISTASDGHSLFMVMERNDWPSSRASYSGASQRLVVDYSADVVITGPFEENIHAENPRAGEAPGRHRPLVPGQAFEMEAAFTGFGANPDDEPWQFHKYLSEQRLDPYDLEVTFNSNGTDGNVRSTGAKDDMVEEVVVETAPIAKRLGIETFILDDGWQARSGDWEPDCGDTPGEPNTDPRWDGSLNSKFRPRFSDCTFEEVRRQIAPMELGLWLTPMSFHPRAQTYSSHPEWACPPVGHATAALSIVDPNSGSNDAGIGLWGIPAIPHVESRIQRAIDDWGVTYFKFDFLVWLDCVGQGDLYDYKEAFIAMVDRLIARNPHVTFQIDETNDYRLFPFESVTRGPSWFQNGSPLPERLLHNLWNLSPYVPAYSLGQHFLGGTQYTKYPVDTLMAIALPGHLTFFSDLRNLPSDVIDQARPWIDFYTSNRMHFSQMTYPLLADPMEKSWTALQTWNPDEGFGSLLAFRQQSDEPTRTIALRNVPPGMTFDFFEGPSGALVRTVTSEQLSAGIDVTIPNKDGAHVVLIKPAEEPEFDPTTTLTYDGDTSVKVGRSVTLSATLVGSDGPIAGAPLTFAFRGRTYTATTGPDGRAVVPAIKATGPPSTYEVIAAYAGSDRYEPSSTRASVRISAGR